MLWDSPPYPNGETELDWAVWDILPDGGEGEPIWDSTGASPGDWVDLSFPLALQPDWVVNEMGCTVFVQDMVTKEVYQAKVELFSNKPPEVTLVNPAPSTENQILSGTIPITWAATDEEDPDNELDISIDYSPDGGNTWVNIMADVDNNVAPFTYDWNTVAGAIPDGIGYLVRVKALDHLGNYQYAYSDEAFTIDNILDDEWFFQVDVTGPNMDININPVEMNPALLSTAGITDAGEYYIGTWDTTQTFTNKNINGDWIFNVYGKTPNPGLTQLDAYLYAKIFTSSSPGTPFDITIEDDENVGLFTTTHLFSWTDTLSGIVGTGDNIIIEFWLGAKGGPYTENSDMTTNPNFDVQSPWTYADWEDSGPGTATEVYQTTGGNLGGYVGVTTAPESTGPGTTVYAYSGYWQQVVTTTFAPFNAELSLDWSLILSSTADPATMSFRAYIETAPGVPTSDPVWNIETTSSVP
ncbi:MAG: hypothetical protein KAJ33_08950, partial [Thermoplasmata archaeon]|nr:hypothetical protein [Thermoplasmata archaeon]